MQTVVYLAKHRVGALIVLPGEQPLERLLEGGVYLDGRVSTPLLLSIFDSSSPGHDGAVIIEGSKIKKFGVHLPLAERFSTFKNLGTRHRAALGLSERSDAMIIVVSEERGTISLAYGGDLKIFSDADELKDKIYLLLREKFFHNAGDRPWHFFITRNMREKILAAGFAMMLWVTFSIQFGAGVINKTFSIPVEFRSLPDTYIIDRALPSEIKVSVSGKNQDFNLLNPQSLKVIVTVPEIKIGWHKIKIDKSFINNPSLLSITNFSPDTVQFHIESVEGK